MSYYRKTLLLLIFFCVKGFSQINEMQFSAGVNNPITDIGREKFFYPNSLSLGIIYKKNIGDRYILRGGLNYHNLQADDKNSTYLYKRNRGYSFSRNLFELSSGIDITFWKYDHFKPENHTPYFIFELSLVYFSYEKPSLINNTLSYTDDFFITLGVPLGLGYKYKIGKFVFSTEYKAVFLYSNNLDGKNISVGGINDNYNINTGTFNKVDWYGNLMFGIAITFGRKECFFCLDKLDDYKNKKKYKFRK